MPIYSYRCECGATFDAFRLCAVREMAVCPVCDHQAMKVFTPAKILVPEHFKLKHVTADWVLPPKDDHEAWDARANPSQTHAPKQETLKDHLERELLSREKITLGKA